MEPARATEKSEGEDSPRGANAKARGAARSRGDASRDAAENGSRDGAGGGFWEQVTTFGIAILIALGVRQFIIEPFRIPSGSMFPTLLIGDHLFVNKFVYGPKLPFSDIRLPGLRAPERGEVVVFTVAKRGGETYPADRHPNLKREEFVKRIIGLPGDEIDLRGGRYFVNGEPMETKPLGERFEDPDGRRLETLEVRLGSRVFRTLDDPYSPGPMRNASNAPIRWPIRVEEGRYFMLGDNRDHSQDSRVWGTVRLAEIKGPAFILYWSWNFNGSWLEVLNPVTWWTVEKRWDRFGDRVE
ncbi:MAG TPA: signal peptidase I [Myxococcota bacterium]|nr:signal peptidase I [Myxococcota bacterium]